MSSVATDGVVGGRLSADEYARNFADLTPPLTRHEAFVEADRCYFCYDAPCQHACPTDDRHPAVHPADRRRQRPRRRRDDLLGQHPRRHVRPRLPDRDAVRGGLRARACRGQAGPASACCSATPPTPLMATGRQPFARAPATGKRVAVVGAGPAGLSCAHRLAVLGPRGHGVRGAGRSSAASTNTASRPTRRRTISPKREVDFILVDRRHRGEARRGARAGRRPRRRCARDYDAVFLGLGLARRQQRSRAWRDCAARGRRGRLHRGTAAGGRQGHGAGRAARRGHRRRHDGDRRGRAVEEARRRGGDDRLPARAGAHEGQPLRAGTGADERRDHPHPGDAEGLRRRRRPRHRRRCSTHRATTGG